MIGCHEVLCNCYREAAMTGDIWKKKIVDECLWAVSIRADQSAKKIDCLWGLWDSEKYDEISTLIILL